MTNSLVYAKARLRRAEHLRNAGRIDAAYYMMLSVLGEFDDHGEETSAAYFRPRAYHQLALIHALRSDSTAAETYFKRSIKEFDPENFIGCGRVTRDYGWWLYQKGKITKGRDQIKAARKLLMQSTNSPRRQARELAVTDGILARTTILNNPLRATETMLRVDDVLRGGDKWIYELDNLKFLIPLLPLTLRPAYMARAKRIELKILFSENFAIFSEDIWEGQPIRALVGFSGRSIKSLF